MKKETAKKRNKNKKKKTKQTNAAKIDFIVIYMK